MKIKLRRKKADSVLYSYGTKLIFSMGIIFAVSALATTTPLVVAAIVIVFTGSFL